MGIRNSSLFNVVSGDLLLELDNGTIDVVLHVCNAFHTMGAGFAKALRVLYPEVAIADKKTKHGDESKVGTNSYANIVTPSGHKVIVVNMYAQYRYGRDSTKLRMGALHDCLLDVSILYPTKRIAMPRIGAGLSGGSWYKIADMVHTVLHDMDYKIFVYMYIGIKNIRHGDKDSKTVVCDRSSALGNPYPMPKYTRDECCDLHYDKLLEQVYYKPDGRIVRVMKSLYEQAKSGGLSLSCHCAPKRCHTENIRDILYMRYYAKIIIAGGRDFTNVDFLNAMLYRHLRMFEHAEIVSGLARGPDTMGLDYAKKNGIPYKEFPALWDDVEGKPDNEVRTNKAGKKYWVKAGYDRNEQMAEYANVLIAFWDKSSKGTKHMIDYARKNHLLVFVINY